jgi:hypothetical protein
MYLLLYLMALIQLHKYIVLKWRPSVNDEQDNNDKLIRFKTYYKKKKINR